VNSNESPNAVSRNSVWCYVNQCRTESYTEAPVWSGRRFKAPFCRISKIPNRRNGISVYQINKSLRPSHFCYVTQCILVFIYRQFSCTAWPLKMGPMGFPETSVTTHQSTLRNILQEREISFAPRRKPEITQITTSWSRMSSSCRNAVNCLGIQAWDENAYRYHWILLCYADILDKLPDTQAIWLRHLWRQHARKNE
jgi:hypothetical protein